MNHFYELSDWISSQLPSNVSFTAWYAGENSDFIRLNHAKVRQAGTVDQKSLQLETIKGQKHIRSVATLSGNRELDQQRLAALISSQIEKLDFLPDDPYLLIANEVNNSEVIGTNHLPSATDTVSEVLSLARDLDLVGIYAGGQTERGFANSLGQRNWFSAHSFNFDFSVYAHTDKAVKSSYAGNKWNSQAFHAQLGNIREQLAVLKQPIKTISPGKYRVFLSPTALQELLSLLSWGGFSLKARMTKHSPLLKMLEENLQFNPAVTLLENVADGFGPSFQSEGFIKPSKISLIENGHIKDALVSPRSAKEYDAQLNGASQEEVPENFDMAGGLLPRKDALKTLDTGLLINNLWYLNYSDKPAGRMTGMTRFATFWVENGQIKAPMQVMRFDDSILRILGENLLAITKEREDILAADTYGGRTTSSARLPGILVKDFTFTL